MPIRFAAIGPQQIAAGGWTPLQLPNLKGWWSADVGVSTSGGNVTTVLDQSGQGNTITASGTVKHQASSWNGLTSFQTNSPTFGALATALAVNMGTASPGNMSVFMYFQMNNNSAAQCEPFGTIGTAGHNDFDGGVGDWIMERSGSNIQALATCNTIGTAWSLDAHHRFGFIYNGTTGKMYVDGVVGANTGTVSRANSATTMISYLCGIRSGSPTDGSSVYGNLVEMLITNDVMTDPNIALLDSYLTGKWGS